MQQKSPQSLGDVLIKQKQNISLQIKGKYARFGEEICGMILAEALKPNGMTHLLKRIQLEPGRTFERQCDILLQFLLEYGGDTFISRYRGVAGSPRVQQQLSGQADVNFDANGKYVGPERRKKPRKRKEVDEMPALFDADGKYVGPERRAGVERRSGRDRREEIDAVAKNQRFGADRRKHVRRKEDTEKDPRSLGMKTKRG